MNRAEQKPPLLKCQSAVYCVSNVPGSPSHEQQTHFELGRRVAKLLGLPFAGAHDPSETPRGPGYWVPDDTIVGAEEALRLGIRSEEDLFGGVVLHPFVATKAISHPLVRPDACAPAGWSHVFARSVRTAALRGFTAFSRADARLAGQQLLKKGPARLKPVRARAGRGQVEIYDRDQLETALQQLDLKELPEYGVVLEENLSDVITYSIGQVRIGNMVASYHGTQRVTRNNNGESVYGGTDLEVVRGEFETLLQHETDEDTRLAIMKARQYDLAARAYFPGLIASRRNYDVAHGLDSAGKRRSGVLEQSWRIGGASTAEIVALEMLRAEPGVDRFRASSGEIYGEDAIPPPGATVFFRGSDEEVGFITKYVTVAPHGNTV